MVHFTFQYLGTQILIPSLYRRANITHRGVTQRWDTGSVAKALCHSEALCSEQIQKRHVSVWQYRKKIYLFSVPQAGVRIPHRSNHKGSWVPVPILGLFLLPPSLLGSSVKARTVGVRSWGGGAGDKSIFSAMKQVWEALG